MPKTADFIILGGGCAGLSLGTLLAKKFPHKTLYILEARPQYIADRTWCFWDVVPHAYDSLVTNRWLRWKLCYQKEQLEILSDHYAYCCIPSEAFYKQPLPSNIHLKMNSRVEKIEEKPNKVVVKDTEEEFEASFVFDSRPQPVKTKGLSQHFHGWKIKTNEKVFDPLSLTLMDFNVSQEKGIHFFYILPFTSTEALVETTYISSTVMSQKEYQDDIKAYLTKKYRLKDYEILYHENGCLPLDLHKLSNTSSRVVNIGTRAGLMRPSTGYAFLEIQKWTNNFVGNFDGNTLSHTSTYVSGNYLDNVFLSYIKKHPHAAADVFFNLFKKNKSDQLIRFLMNEATPFETLKIVLSMPKLAMTKQAIHYSLGL